MAGLTALVAEILDSARLDEGLLTVRREPFDIHQLTEEVASVISRPDHAVVVQPPQPIIVSADPRLTRQCLANIVANAIQHSPPNAAVTVNIGPERRDGSEWVKVSVVDEGHGIAPELLPHIFDRFVSGRQAGGLGLGLYLAKRIATVQGGQLSVESPPGKGAHFALLLPPHRQA